MLSASRTLAIALTGSAALLSGCGGTQLLSFDETVLAEGALVTKWGGIVPTVPSTLPPGGSATYDGYIIAATPSDEFVVAGELEMIANFLTPEVTGTARNFVDENDVRLGGTLAITNGAINRAATTNPDFTFVADLDGTLTDPGDSYLVDGTLSGDFFGTSYGAVFGPVGGTVTADFGTLALDGVFIAER